MAEKHLLDRDEPPSPSRRSQSKRLRPSLPSAPSPSSLLNSTPSRQVSGRQQHHQRPPLNQKMALAALARARADRPPDPPPDDSKRSGPALDHPLEPPAPVPGPSSRSPPDSVPVPSPPVARPAPKHRPTRPPPARRRSPSISSADDYVPLPMASWNPDEARKALQPSQPESSNQDELRKAKDELERAKKEAASYKDMIGAQTILLDSVRSSLSCNICLEILDSPYALLCGHIFCHKDLYAWFHRKGLEFDSDELDFLSDEEAGHPDQRHHHHEQGHSEDDETDSERASVNRELAEAVQGGPLGRRAGVGPTGRAVPSRMTRELRKRNLICPQCRAPVGARPLPLYAIKEAADRLRTADGPGSAGAGAEGPLRADVEGHRDERDLSWGGLFPNGGGGGRGGARPHVVLDVDDGVRRCGVCAWELDGHGVCEGCGEMYSDTGFSDEHFSSGGHDDSIDLGTMYGTDSDEAPFEYGRHVLAPYAGSVDSDESDIGSGNAPVRVPGRRRFRAPASDSDSDSDSDGHGQADSSEAEGGGFTDPLEGEFEPGASDLDLSGAESGGFNDPLEGHFEQGASESESQSESEGDDDQDDHDQTVESPNSDNDDSDDSSIE